MLALVLALFALNAVLHYPGLMNNDSQNQYAEAVAGQFTDWHPPVMAWLWSYLRLIGDGPGPFLMLHLLAYWAGFGLLADAMRRLGRPRLAWLVALAGAFPPFLYINATVMKDVGLVAFWLAAVGYLFWIRSQDRRVPPFGWLVVAAFIAYGTLVRSNAVFGLGPLLLYALAPVGWLRTGRLMIAAVLVALLAIPASQFANRVFFDAAGRSPAHSLFLFDLMGIARHTGDPAVIAPRANFSQAELKDCYTPYWWDSLSPWGRCGSRVARPDPVFVAAGDGLAVQWASAIAAHPLAYAQHRLKHFNSALLFAVPLKHIRLTPEYRTDDPAISPMEQITERDIRLDLLRKSPAIWPVVWLVWAMALLVFATRLPAEPNVLVARVLLVSALGYSGAYLIAGVATDMRYHYWSMISILLSSVVLLPELVRFLRQKSALLWGGLAAVGLVTGIGVLTRVLDYQALVR
ncbi:MAG: glycosyltransferase family 39 protein [Polaromonas sp.]|nr:glycosyltransferase family 39 protein [Polaromonas sp.]